MNNNSQDRIVKQLESTKFYKELKRYSHNPTFTTVFSVFFALILVSIAIRPSLAKISELKSNIEKLEKLDTQLSTKLSILKKLEPQYQKAVAKKDLLNYCLPTQPAVETFERQIRYYVQKNSLPFKSLSISAFPVIDSDKKEEILKAVKKQKSNKSDEVAKELANFAPITYTISLEGGYNNIKSFIYDFQKNIRATQIDSISINKSDENYLKLSISGSIYYYSDKDL
jgi:Tfp pilus assembly protein PilO